MLVDFERTPSHSPISACKVPGACDERRPVSDCSPRLRSWVRGQYVPVDISAFETQEQVALRARGARRCDGGRATGAPGIFGCEADAHTLRARTVQHGVVAERQEPIGSVRPLVLGLSRSQLCDVAAAEELFAGLGPFQQMLWMLDEMDYQWRALLARAKSWGWAHGRSSMESHNRRNRDRRRRERDRTATGWQSVQEQGLPGGRSTTREASCCPRRRAVEI